MDDQQLREERRQKLRAELRAKIGEKSIDRSTKKHKEQILEKTLATMDIDVKKFKEDM